ncbi:MAG: DNA-processing protein DprA [Phycisphaera sp.]|nr:DNA-processing protein DprA [Phycisphaera sp.]
MASMIRTLTPAELIGPLNDLEEAYAPKELYVQGDTDLMRGTRRVSIVGSRKPSPNGIKRARKLARQLVEEDVVIVSGLAEGIDSIAHRTAIELGGSTVAVIGTPLDKTYPAKHASLQAEIAEDHLVVSQFPVGTQTYPSHFPARNRVMALVSHATVIVEASEKSGTRHQGWEAIRLGRPLFIAQSLIDAKVATWIDEQLSYGAQPLSDETFADLIDQLPPKGFDPRDVSVESLLQKSA